MDATAARRERRPDAEIIHEARHANRPTGGEPLAHRGGHVDRPVDAHGLDRGVERRRNSPRSPKPVDDTRRVRTRRRNRRAGRTPALLVAGMPV